MKKVPTWSAAAQRRAMTYQDGESPGFPGIPGPFALPLHPVSEGVLELAPGTYGMARFQDVELVLHGDTTFEACQFRGVRIRSPVACNVEITRCEGLLDLDGRGCLSLVRCDMGELSMSSWTGTIYAKHSDIRGMRVGRWELEGDDLFEDCSLRGFEIKMWRQRGRADLVRCDLANARVSELVGVVGLADCHLTMSYFSVNRASRVREVVHPPEGPPPEKKKPLRF